MKKRKSPGLLDKLFGIARPEEKEIVVRQTPRRLPRKVKGSVFSLYFIERIYRPGIGASFSNPCLVPIKDVGMVRCYYHNWTRDSVFSQLEAIAGAMKEDSVRYFIEVVEENENILDRLIEKGDEENYAPLTKPIKDLCLKMRRDAEVMNGLLVEISKFAGNHIPAYIREELAAKIRAPLLGINDLCEFIVAEMEEGEKEEESARKLSNLEIIKWLDNKSLYTFGIRRGLEKLVSYVNSGIELEECFKRDITESSKVLIPTLNLLKEEIDFVKEAMRIGENSPALHVDHDRLSEAFSLSPCEYLFHQDDRGYLCGEMEDGNFLECGKCFFDDPEVSEYPHCPYDRSCCSVETFENDKFSINFGRLLKKDEANQE